jgi:hypothetical protein
MAEDGEGGSHLPSRPGTNMDLVLVDWKYLWKDGPMVNEETETYEWPHFGVLESTWTTPTDWCPNPDWWTSTDDDSTEIEVTCMVKWMIVGLQPRVVVETGTAWGQTAHEIGDALRINGRGHLHSFEVNKVRVDASRRRCEGLPVSVHQMPSLQGIEWLKEVTNHVDFVWLDSLFNLRLRELENLMPLFTERTVIGIHDTAPHHPLHRDLVKLKGFRRIDFHTPRGVSFLQLDV